MHCVALTEGKQQQTVTGALLAAHGRERPVRRTPPPVQQSQLMQVAITLDKLVWIATKHLQLLRD